MLENPNWFLIAMVAIWIFLTLYHRFFPPPLPYIRHGLKPQIDAQFAACVIHASDPRFTFDPNQVEIIHEYEEGAAEDEFDNNPLASHAVARWLCNPAGEYFFFMSGPTSGFIKHVPQATAKVVLGKLYREPTGPS